MNETIPRVGDAEIPAPTHISLYGTVPDSIVDGPGLRYAVFVQGCTHNCPGCHNPESQPVEGGTITALDDLLADIEANGLVHDVTLSGGEPFEQPAACAILARALKERGYGVWSYSGYLYDDLSKRATTAREEWKRRRDAGATGAAAFADLVDDLAVGELLDSIDVLVDGPFVEAQKSYSLKWRGSANQRLIDIGRTRSQGQVVLWSNEQSGWEKPPSW